MTDLTIKELILKALEDNESMTITEIKKCKGLENFSKQKLLALLNQMIEEKTVVRSNIRVWTIFENLFVQLDYLTNKK